MTNLLSFHQLMSAVSTVDINVAHCAAVGLAIDLYVIDHGEIDDKDKAFNILNTFTQTDKIVFNHEAYHFGRIDTVDTVEQKLLDLFQQLRRNGFRATEFFEDDDYIGFQDRFGVVLKARKVGDIK